MSLRNAMRMKIYHKKREKEVAGVTGRKMPRKKSPEVVQRADLYVPGVRGRKRVNPRGSKKGLGEDCPRKRVADGSPKMFFVCYHSANGNQELFVGADQANWTGLPTIGQIRREDRDLRLSSYSPLATRAYNALRQAEENAILPASMANLPDKAKTYQVRMRAIAAMKTGPHPDFLGRVTEVGRAFDKTMKAQQCRYACKRMMEYRVLGNFTQNSIEDNLCNFGWENRGDYPHSCAEVEVSLQCSRHWVEKGRGARY
jgi:hypothetical protein